MPTDTLDPMSELGLAPSRTIDPLKELGIGPVNPIEELGLATAQPDQKSAWLTGAVSTQANAQNADLARQANLLAQQRAQAQTDQSNASTDAISQRFNINLYRQRMASSQPGQPAYDLSAPIVSAYDTITPQEVQGVQAQRAASRLVPIPDEAAKRMLAELKARPGGVIRPAPPVQPTEFVEGNISSAGRGFAPMVQPWAPGAADYLRSGPDPQGPTQQIGSVAPTVLAMLATRGLSLGPQAAMLANAGQSIFAGLDEAQQTGESTGWNIPATLGSAASEAGSEFLGLEWMKALSAKTAARAVARYGNGNASIAARAIGDIIGGATSEGTEEVANVVGKNVSMAIGGVITPDEAMTNIMDQSPEAFAGGALGGGVLEGPIVGLHTSHEMRHATQQSQIEQQKQAYKDAFYPAPQMGTATTQQPQQPPTPPNRPSDGTAPVTAHPDAIPTAAEVRAILAEARDLATSDAAAGIEPHQFDGAPPAVQREYDRAYRLALRNAPAATEDQGATPNQLTPDPASDVAAMGEAPTLTQGASNDAGQETQGRQEGLLSPAAETATDATNLPEIPEGSSQVAAANQTTPNVRLSENVNSQEQPNENGVRDPNAMRTVAGPRNEQAPVSPVVSSVQPLVQNQGVPTGNQPGNVADQRSQPVGYPTPAPATTAAPTPPPQPAAQPAAAPASPATATGKVNASTSVPANPEIRQRFDSRGEGHKALSAAFDKAVEQGALRPVDADILMEVFHGTDDRQLGKIKLRTADNTTAASILRDKAGQARPGVSISHRDGTHTLIIARNLAKMADSNPADLHPAAIVVEEYAHASWSLLTGDEQAAFQKAYDQMGDTGRKEYLKSGIAEDAEGVNYANDNPQEFWARVVVEYMMTGRTPLARLKDLLQKVADKLWKAIGRITARDARAIQDPNVMMLRTLARKAAEGRGTRPAKLKSADRLGIQTMQERLIQAAEGTYLVRDPSEWEQQLQQEHPDATPAYQFPRGAKGNGPGEVAAMLETGNAQQRQKMRDLLISKEPHVPADERGQTMSKNRKAGGEDWANAIGWDNFHELALLITGNKLAVAQEKYKKLADSDPVGYLMGYLLENGTRKNINGAKDPVPVNDMTEGSAFALHGIPMTIEQGPSGLQLTSEGMQPVPLAYFDKAVPTDVGSFVPGTGISHAEGQTKASDGEDVPFARPVPGQLGLFGARVIGEDTGTQGTMFDMKKASEPTLDRRAVVEQAKLLGLPRTGTTESIARRNRIMQTSPAQWTRDDFNQVKSSLAIHQDVKPGSDGRVQSIVRDGLNSGMVDSVDAMDEGRWTWGRRLLDGNAYIFSYYLLKFRSKDSPALAAGNRPLFHIKTRADESIFDAMTRATPTQHLAESPNAIAPRRENETLADYKLRLKSAEAEKATGRLFARAIPSTIDVDGTQRPTTNSDGKPIHATEEGTRAFWKWFGNSKVVDEQGKPRVMYHGAGERFTQFDIEKTGNVGFYFTPDATEAGAYARGANQHYDWQKRVMPVTLKVENPAPSAIVAAEYERASGGNPRSTAHDSLKARGYDGFIRKDGAVVTFSPTQIKSATGNAGTFDPANPDIRFARPLPNQPAIPYAANKPTKPTEPSNAPRKTLAGGLINEVHTAASRLLNTLDFKPTNARRIINTILASRSLDAPKVNKKQRSAMVREVMRIVRESTPTKTTTTVDPITKKETTVTETIGLPGANLEQALANSLKRNQNNDGTPAKAAVTAEAQAKREGLTSRIRRLTGQTDESGTVTTTKAKQLDSMFAREAKAARRAYSAGKAQERLIARTQLEELRAMLTAKAKRTALTAQNVKDALVGLIKRNIRPASQGKFLSAVAGSKSFPALMRAQTKVERLMFVDQGKAANAVLRALGKAKVLSKLDNERRDAIRAILDQTAGDSALFIRGQSGRVTPQISKTTGKPIRKFVASNVQLASAAMRLEKHAAAIKEIIAEHKAETARIGASRHFTLKEVKNNALDNINRLPERGKDAYGITKVDNALQTARRIVNATDNMATITTKVEGVPAAKSSLHQILVAEPRIAESKRNAAIRDTVAKLETAARDFGYKSLTDAEVDSGLLGPAETKYVTVRLGGQQIKMKLGQLAALHAHFTDPGTRVLMHKGQTYNLEEDPTAAPFHASAEDVERAVSQLTPTQRAALEKGKASKNDLTKLAWEAIRRIKGNEPPMLPNHYTRRRNMKLSASAAENAGDDFGFSNMMFAAAENAGFTIDRVADTKTPILLGDFWHEMQDQIHQLAQIAYMAEPLRNAVSVLKDPKIVTAISSRHGEPTYKRMTKMLSAFTGVENQGDMIGRAAQTLGAMHASATLSLNANTWLQNVVSISRLLDRYTADELSQAIRDGLKLTVNDVTQASGYFHDRLESNAAARMLGVIQHSGESTAILKGLAASFRNLKRGEFKGSWQALRRGLGTVNIIQHAEGVLARVALAAARNKVASRTDLTRKQREILAIRMAENSVRDTANPSSPLDQSYLSIAGRKHTLGAFTLYSSDSQTQVNRIKQAAINGGKPALARALASELPNFILSTSKRFWKTGAIAGLIAAAISGLSGNWDEWDRRIRDMTNPRTWASEAGNAAASAVLPVGGNTLYDVGAKMLDGDRRTTFDSLRDIPSPAVSTVVNGITDFAKLGESLVEALKGEKNQASKDAAKLITGTLSTTVGNPAQPVIGAAKAAWSALTTPDSYQRAALVKEAARALDDPQAAGAILRPMLRNLKEGDLQRLGAALIRQGPDGKLTAKELAEKMQGLTPAQRDAANRERADWRQKVARAIQAAQQQLNR